MLLLILTVVFYLGSAIEEGLSSQSETITSKEGKFILQKEVLDLDVSDLLVAEIIDVSFYDGYLYLLGRSPSSLFKISLTTRRVEELPFKKGRGPCEIELPWQIESNQNGIYIWDASQLKLVHMTNELDYCQEYTPSARAIKDFKINNNLFVYRPTGGGVLPQLVLYDLIDSKVKAEINQQSDEEIVLNASSQSGGLTVSNGSYFFSPSNKLQITNVSGSSVKNTWTFIDNSFKVQPVQDVRYFYQEPSRIINYILESSRVVNLQHIDRHFLLFYETGSISMSRDGGTDYSNRSSLIQIVDENMEFQDVFEVPQDMFQSNYTFISNQNSLFQTFVDPISGEVSVNVFTLSKLK